MIKKSIILFCLACQAFVVAARQADTTRTDRLYTMSGLGFAFPVGETADYLGPKFSTTIGLNIGLGKSGLFLYPEVSLHAFSFDGQVIDPGYSHTVQKGRATTYLLNMNLGYRKIINKVAFYGFAGGGGGFVLSPRATVNQQNSTINMENKTNWNGLAEIGGGVEYNIGGANLFLQAAYMRGFSDFEGKVFQTVPVSVGIKPNLSKLLNKLK
ncbi:autotransporter outer membrane beta-barrel domain-containing protein [Pedobacter sp. SYP-B3415]|uniref:autotransporter outer membrane beta-barrel domain-containing protein n=1 Tax=Pedobacter sp. SYP-B3415 TaxID=2496641 RepID=UPI00101C34E8|nr:autotransporter outer membrane beta-barrel domain-containing protein [Pedobacter sp. SYP-B3415]